METKRNAKFSPGTHVKILPSKAWPGDACTGYLGIVQEVMGRTIGQDQDYYIGPVGGRWEWIIAESRLEALPL